jgi:adenosine deaminase
MDGQPTTRASAGTPPCAELHVHLEGTLEPEAVLQMATRNGLPAPAGSVQDLRDRYRFTDLQSFLDIYYDNMSVLRTETDFYDMATSYIQRAGMANVRHAEMFFDPQAHIVRGVPVDAMMQGLSAALEDGRRTHGITTGLIMCFLRHLGAEAADDAYTALQPYRSHLLGVGLDSTELGYPPELFRAVFSRAGADGLRLVAHAGEEDGPQAIRSALDVLKVERVDHGIRALDDPDLIRRLRDEQTPLTVCPLSNVALRVTDTLAQHPLPDLMSAGVAVTVNSDDPSYFGGYIDDNFAAVVEHCGLSSDDVADLAANSFRAAFIEDQERAVLLAAVEEYRRGSG